MTAGVHPTQQVTLNQGTQATHRNGGQQQRREKAEQGADAVAEVGSQHVEAGVGKIKHAHEAEHQRQACTEHEEQQPIAQTVQQRDNE